MKKLKEAKNYKDLKTRITPYESEIKEFGNSLTVLNADLSSILKEYTQARDASLPVKEKFRTIREFYNTNINDLKPLEKPFIHVLYFNIFFIYLYFS